MNDAPNEVPTPIPSTLDKLDEAGYFFFQMLEHYHDPFRFRFSLSAYVQAIRNVTFVLQSEENKPDGFDEWYQTKRQEMQADAVLKNLRDARNIVVKQRSLATQSQAFVGIFRYRRFKLGMKLPVNPFQKNEQLLEDAKKFFIGQNWIDEAHGSIGEEIGIQREWICSDIGEREVTATCLPAFNYLIEMMIDLHTRFGIEFTHYRTVNPDLSKVQVLTESDLDPSLPEKWGW